jgi:hypothetical protein
MDNEYMRPINLYMGEGRVTVSGQYVLWLQEMLDRIADLAIGVQDYVEKFKSAIPHTYQSAVLGMDVEGALYKIKEIRRLADYKQEG